MKIFTKAKRFVNLCDPSGSNVGYPEESPSISLGFTLDSNGSANHMFNSSHFELVLEIYRIGFFLTGPITFQG